MMSQINLLQSFMRLFQSLGYCVTEPLNLFNGITIAQFLCSIQNTHILASDIAKDEGIRGVALKNFKLIVSEIERYNRQQLGNKSYEAKFDVNQIFVAMDKEQLIKMLKDCFIMATRAPNSSDFIQKILTLDENSQVLFAQLIKSDNNYVASPPHNSQVINTSKQNLREHALDLIDKLYQSQMQNQRLAGQLKKWQAENTQMRQTIVELYSQLDTVKSYNQMLKKDLIQNNEIIQKLRNKKLKQNEKQNKNDECRKQLQNLLNAYKQEADIITLKFQVSRRQYQAKLFQLQNLLQRQEQQNIRMREQLQYYQNKFEVIIKKGQESQAELYQAIKQNKKLVAQLQKAMESQTALKFEVNYKNLQIQQLKQLISSHTLDLCKTNRSNKKSNQNANNINSNINANINIVDYQDSQPEFSYNRHQRYSGISFDEKLSEKKKLANQFSSPNVSSSPNLRRSLILQSQGQQFQQMRALKNTIKQLQRQNQKSKGLKNKIKDLQYEKNKLTKILQEYQSSRGEQNDIITGCLYELHLRMGNNKNIFSTSTIQQDIYNNSNITNSKVGSSRVTLQSQLINY